VVVGWVIHDKVTDKGGACLDLARGSVGEKFEALRDLGDFGLWPALYSHVLLAEGEETPGEAN